MELTSEVKHQMKEIIERKEIKAVFQPIVSLKTGEIYGYEALSRITLPNCSFNIGEAFEIAQEINCLWAFEKLCRIHSIKMSSKKPRHAKLFLNVDPNIIHDNDFKSGVTRDKLRKNNLDCNDIVFEATERSAIRDMKTFRSSLQHYKDQGFRVAIDDVGSGYSNLNRIFDINPHFIKIDMQLIKNIDKDERKRSFVSALSQFASDSNIALIAEGIETAEQLDTVISLHVDYAQGYYLAKPNPEFIGIDSELRHTIQELAQKYNKPKCTPTYFRTVSGLCVKKTAILPTTCFSEVYKIMDDPDSKELAVVDESGKFLGYLTKRDVLQSLSGMYGYTLNAKKRVQEVIDSSCLTITPETPIEAASKMAMARCQPYTYDSIPVIDDATQEYLGFVSIKDLLLSAVDIQVKRATDCNPLTGLPGNVVIDEMVEHLLKSEEPFAIIYFDLDNFKAYNDAYGFANGDKMIRILADILKASCRTDDFCGHIGGDDFVIITKGDRTEELCQTIFQNFAKDSLLLYSELDIKNGYIVSKNRNGFTENFPLATLSAAAITNRVHSYATIEELSLTVAKAKKQAKKSLGNSLVIF